MNPYQKIPGVQEGHIDTKAKFAQLVDGAELDGRSVLDVGCNLGEMTRLLASAGARARGIDVEPEFVADARRLTIEQFGVQQKNLIARTSFAVQDGYRATGHYDLAVVSAAFHYFQDPVRLVEQLARVADVVRLDVWVGDEGQAREGAAQAMWMTERRLFVPDYPALMLIFARGFDMFEPLGEALAPDNSCRRIYELTAPRREQLRRRAVVLYGGGGSGKTTRARELVNVGWAHYQLDQAYLDWRMTHMKGEWSVDWAEKTLRGEHHMDYVRFVQERVSRFAENNYGLDIVVEGYSAFDDAMRASVVAAVLYGIERAERADGSPNVLYGDVEEIQA